MYEKIGQLKIVRNYIFMMMGERKQQKDMILHNFEANQIVKLSKPTEVSVYTKPIYRKAKSFHLLTGFL